MEITQIINGSSVPIFRVQCSFFVLVDPAGQKNKRRICRDYGPSYSISYQQHDGLMTQKKIMITLIIGPLLLLAWWIMSSDGFPGRGRE